MSSIDQIRVTNEPKSEATLIQQRIAYIVVWIPTIGALLTGYLGWVYGVEILDIAILAVMYVATIVGIEVGFHRYMSHHAFVAIRPLGVLLVILGSMAAQGPVMFWASTHRRHHAFSDQGGDPHSPKHQGSGMAGLLRGLFHAHMGWLFKPQQGDWMRYARDLLKDRTLIYLNLYYWVWILLGLVLPGVVCGLITGTWFGALKGFLWGGLLRIFLVHHVVWSVNSLCHQFGTRPFQTREDSRNNVWLALFSLGGSWHNNHHAFPRTADNRMAWWQIDLCGLIIRALGALRLVRKIYFPPREVREARRAAASKSS